jgi:uncharacterized phage protein gp47/JayE
MSGVTPTGFESKTYEEIAADLEAALKSTFGSSIPTHPSSRWGQLIGIFAERFALLWELAEDVYSAGTPSGATGQAASELAAITGTIREGATKSIAVVTATGTPGTVIPAGRIFSVVGTAARFVTLADATITGGGTVDVDVEAEETGPISALAGELTVIETPVSGLASITNAEDAVEGREQETDEALMTRREAELRGSGASAVEAVWKAVRNVPGVTAVQVFENDTEATDGDGIPLKSIEVLVAGGDDDDIREAIFASKTGGIRAHGTLSGTVTFNGKSYTIKHTRPTELEVWVTANLTVDAATFPMDGATRVRDAIVAWGDTNLTTGRDVTAAALSAQAFTVPGVLDAVILLGLVDPPSVSTTVAVGIREVADLDTGRTEVNTTPGTP